MAKEKEYPIGKCPRANVASSKEEFDLPKEIEAQLSKNYKGRSDNFYQGDDEKI